MMRTMVSLLGCIVFIYIDDTIGWSRRELLASTEALVDLYFAAVGPTMSMSEEKPQSHRIADSLRILGLMYRVYKNIYEETSHTSEAS